MPMNRPLLLLVCFLSSTLPLAHAADMARPPITRPNVLFIAIDDLRDWVGYLGYQLAMNYIANTVSASVYGGLLRFSA